LHKLIQAYKDLYRLLKEPQLDDERVPFGAFARHCTEHVLEFCPVDCENLDGFFFTPPKYVKVKKYLAAACGYSAFTISNYANFRNLEQEQGYVVIFEEHEAALHQYIIWERPINNISSRPDMFKHFYSIDHCVTDITTKDIAYCTLSADEVPSLPIAFPEDILPQFRYLNRIGPNMKLIPEFEYLRYEHPICIPSKIRQVTK